MARPHASLISAAVRHLTKSSHQTRRWEGGDPGVANQKSPTSLLLTPDLRFHSFGFAARDFYHDLDPEEARHWLYFDKFKMKIHSTSVRPLTFDLRPHLPEQPNCLVFCCRTSPWKRSWRRSTAGGSTPSRCSLTRCGSSGSTP